ncbi:hypothetical protein [Candidatus Protochlamydia sp. R18]|uniref:hypothetical protein n=1 Tax=Candidatus Protochlamydia sp. R18 TaxID=1353977 RepID=UPI000694ACD2|nr:hypothetical protein [Candidatus Protochlamydia sp. R18]
MKFFRFKNLGWGILAFASIGLISYFLILEDELDSRNLTSHARYEFKWEITAFPKELAKIDKILEQSFSYLGEGGQSYVFSSEDQKYVLKFFKFKRFKPSYLVKKLPNSYPFKNYRDKHIAKKKQKLMRVLKGHKLAYDFLKRESGLIFIQLNPSNLSKWITLVDKGNQKRKVNLETVSYILQEKGEMLSQDLTYLLNQGNLTIAKQRVDQVLGLYLSEYQKGIYDLDYGIMHNIGCRENKVFHLDVGKLIVDERMKQPEFYQKNIVKVASKLQKWFSSKYPQYSRELIDHLEKKLSVILDRKFTFSQSAGSVE